MCTHASACRSARGALLAFSLEKIRIARAHTDPREDHHQDPWCAENKSDPFFALSSLIFCTPSSLQPPNALHPLYHFMASLVHSFTLNFLQIIHLWFHLVPYEACWFCIQVSVCLRFPTFSKKKKKIGAKMAGEEVDSYITSCSKKIFSHFSFWEKTLYPLFPSTSTMQSLLKTH